MRQSRNNEMLVVDGKLVGVNLGADYCAEHEWGIKGIRSTFGIDVTKVGVDQRKISKTTDRLVWLDKILFNPKNKKEKTKWSGFYLKKYLDDDHYFDGYPYSTDLYTQWDEGGFCAVASSDEKIAQLKQIYEAFAKNDIVIWLGGGGPFQNAGLAIAIASHLPQEVVDGWHQHDIEHNKLMADFLATGIKEKLEKAGKRYFALSPRRQEDGSLIFWLNPMEQKIHNSGWFKLEELEQWARNEGPIIMKEPKKR